MQRKRQRVKTPIRAGSPVGVFVAFRLVGVSKPGPTGVSTREVLRVSPMRETLHERKPIFFSEGTTPQDFLFSEGTTPHESLKTLVCLAVQMRKTLF